MLIRRLKQQFAPGGLLHYGQGKWYPGESLPRWALGCCWRRDGVPIWNDDRLIADETIDYGHGEREARRFIDALAGRARRRTADACMPAYEDVWYYLWRERRLPVNVDPAEVGAEGRRGAGAARAGLRAGPRPASVGYVLPLRRHADPGSAAQWASGTLVSAARASVPDSRRFADRLSAAARLAAVGGAGRLSVCLRARSVGRAAAAAASGRASPSDPPGSRPWPIVEPVRWTGRNRRANHRTGCPRPGDSAKDIVRTALCVEPRHGRLHVFMPPVTPTEDYLDLVAAIEADGGDAGDAGRHRRRAAAVRSAAQPLLR